eukprot:3748596-Rhodomonas_salina.1
MVRRGQKKDSAPSRQRMAWGGQNQDSAQSKQRMVRGGGYLCVPVHLPGSEQSRTMEGIQVAGSTMRLRQCPEGHVMASRSDVGYLRSSGRPSLGRGVSDGAGSCRPLRAIPNETVTRLPPGPRLGLPRVKTRVEELLPGG